MPDLASLEKAVVISGTNIALTEKAPVQTVTVTNHMTGPIGIEVATTKMDGIKVELEKNKLDAGEIAGLRFSLTGKSKVSGLVRVTCSPLGQEFDIQITGN
jgi:P pilus assembly chaperone PapD